MSIWPYYIVIHFPTVAFCFFTCPHYVSRLKDSTTVTTTFLCLCPHDPHFLSLRYMRRSKMEIGATWDPDRTDHLSLSIQKVGWSVPGYTRQKGRILYCLLIDYSWQWSLRRYLRAQSCEGTTANSYKWFQGWWLGMNHLIWGKGGW